MGNWAERVRRSEEEVRIETEKVQAEEARDRLRRLEVLQKTLEIFSIRELLQEVRNEVWREGEIYELVTSYGGQEPYVLDRNSNSRYLPGVNDGACYLLSGFRLTTEFPGVSGNYREVTREGGGSYGEDPRHHYTTSEFVGYSKRLKRISLDVFAVMTFDHTPRGYYQVTALKIRDHGVYLLYDKELPPGYEMRTNWSTGQSWIEGCFRNPYQVLPGGIRVPPTKPFLVDGSRLGDKLEPEVLECFNSRFVKLIEHRRACNSLPAQLREDGQKEIIRLKL